MAGVVIQAGRRVLAAFVILSTGCLVLWLAAFRVGLPSYTGGKAMSQAELASLPTRCAVGADGCYAVRPEWTIPAAVAIACLGLAAAALLYRGRPNWPLAPRANGV